MNEPKYITKLKSIGTEELAKMNRQEVLKLLKQTAPRVEAKRQKAVNQLDKWGINPFNYREGADSKTVRSWRNTSFDYSPNESLGKLKSRVRTMQRFVNSNATSVEGIKESIKNAVNRYYQLLGKEPPKKIIYANQFNNVAKFWDTIDKLRELRQSRNNWGSVGSTRAFEEIAMEMNNKDFDGDINKLLNHLEEFIKDEYETAEEERIQNTPREFTTSSFFDEEGND